jgi:DnaJ family protein C protein 3
MRGLISLVVQQIALFSILATLSVIPPCDNNNAACTNNNSAVWKGFSISMMGAAADPSADGGAASGGHVMTAGKFRSMGEEAMLERRYVDAVDLLEQAIALEPDNVMNVYKLYNVHKRMNAMEHALKDLNRCLELKPDNAGYRKERAKLYVALAQCDLAVPDYKLLIAQQTKKDANMPTALDNDFFLAKQCSQEIHLATAYYQRQEYPKALTYLNSVIHKIDHPTHQKALDLLYMRADSALHLKDYYACVTDTGKILKQQPNHLEAYMLRGDAYFYLNELEASVNHYRTCLKYDPEHKGCKSSHKRLKAVQKKVKRGDEAALSNKHSDAIDHWIQAMEAAEQASSFCRTTKPKLITSYGTLGQHEAAIKLARELLDEETTTVHELVLGDALMNAEQYDEAVRVYRAARDNTQDQAVRQHQIAPKLKKAEAALKQSKEKNYYKVLGLRRDATKKEIKAAYRKLALEWHPDKNNGEEDDEEKAQKMFHDINEAHEVLHDDDLRARYDRGEDVMENQGNGGGGGGGGGFNPFQQQGFQQRGGPGGGQQRTHFRYG